MFSDVISKYKYCHNFYKETMYLLKAPHNTHLFCMNANTINDNLTYDMKSKVHHVPNHRS